MHVHFDSERRTKLRRIARCAARTGSRLCASRSAAPWVALRSTRADAESVRHVEPLSLSEGRRGRVWHVPRQPGGDRAAIALSAVLGLSSPAAVVRGFTHEKGLTPRFTTSPPFFCFVTSVFWMS